MPEFTNKYYNMSQGEGDAEGPWNTGPLWENVSERESRARSTAAAGLPSKLGRKDQQALAAAARTASDPTSDPTTGAEVGAGRGSGLTDDSAAGTPFEPQISK